MKVPIVAGLAALLICARPAAGQEGQVGISVSLDEEAPQTLQALQATDFTVRPSVTSSTIGAGVRTLALRIICVDLFTGQIINNCNVVLTHQPQVNSGGHNHHSASRPKGTFQPASGSTGTSGLSTTYTSPEVSGVIETIITGTAPNGTPLIPGVFTIGVEIAGLVALGAGANYDLVGATATHVDNHYGTGGMNGSLVTLANSFAAAFSGGRLAYNDMSLVTGGLFDINATWARPHASHRFGVDADLRLVPVAQRRRLRQLITASGISTVFVEGNHWHLRQ
jgi:hypothetical protein